MWQFTNEEAIPRLRAVLAALPGDLHPLEVAGLVTTHLPGLAVADEPTSPTDWLTHGGDVDTVRELVAHLDTW